MLEKLLRCWCHWLPMGTAWPTACHTTVSAQHQSMQSAQAAQLLARECYLSAVGCYAIAEGHLAMGALLRGVVRCGG